MSVVEGIKGAGMTYQGSGSTAQVKAEAQPKVEAQEIETASREIAHNTMNISTHETSDEGSGNGTGNQYDAETIKKLQEQQNAKIRKAVEDINKKAMNSEAIFGIHEATNRVTIKIVDKGTREVIKELPPEKTLDMIAKAWEMAGLMVDERR